jgi:hypothetical protein
MGAIAQLAMDGQYQEEFLQALPHHQAPDTHHVALHLQKVIFTTQHQLH